MKGMSPPQLRARLLGFSDGPVLSLLPLSLLTRTLGTGEPAPRRIPDMLLAIFPSFLLPSCSRFELDEPGYRVLVFQETRENGSKVNMSWPKMQFLPQHYNDFRVHLFQEVHPHSHCNTWDTSFLFFCFLQLFD